jgi:hypothetical protein
MRLFVGGERQYLDWEILRGMVQIEENPRRADVLVSVAMDFDHARIPRWQWGNAVSVLIEPPNWISFGWKTETQGRATFVYDPPIGVDRYHPLTLDPLCYPWQPMHTELFDARRYDRLPDRRVVYFAGRMDDQVCRAPDSDGRVNLYGVRKAAVSTLAKFGVSVCSVGDGGNRVVTRRRHVLGQVKNDGAIEEARHRKFVDMDACGADFVLCLENSVFGSYVTEKMHDGLLSGRVPLYLGCGIIEQFVPMECMVDLRGYFDMSVKSVYWKRVADIVREMGDDEYGRIVRRCREFVLGCQADERWTAERRALTQRVLSVLGCR